MFTYLQQQWQMARQIYGHKSWRETRRCVLFTGRSIKNRREVKELTEFFQHYRPLPELLKRHIGLYEVINRVFFYSNSQAKDRLTAIKEHFVLAGELLTEDALRHIYNPQENDKVLLFADKELETKCYLWYHAGQRKEGLWSLFLTLRGEYIYHINFRLGKNRDGEKVFWVGTIQGHEDTLALAKTLTKKMHGYRPKNFMFFLLRQLAENAGISHIYAVSDKGFYSNSHLIRIHRNKKVKFDGFWQEMGGTLCAWDDKFYEIPIAEERKTYETAKTHKRNMYRKRYEMLDAYIAQIKNNCETFLRRN